MSHVPSAQSVIRLTSELAGLLNALSKLSQRADSHGSADTELCPEADSTGVKVFYWREGQKEVDFIIQKGKSLTALEVKSGRKRESLSGISTFSERFRPQRTILLGEGGISLERFLHLPIETWVT